MSVSHCSPGFVDTEKRVDQLQTFSSRGSRHSSWTWYGERKGTCCGELNLFLLLRPIIKFMFYLIADVVTLMSCGWSYYNMWWRRQILSLPTHYYIFHRYTVHEFQSHKYPRNCTSFRHRYIILYFIILYYMLYMGHSCTMLTFSYTVNYPGSHLGLGCATRSCRPKFLFKPILRTQIANSLYNRQTQYQNSPIGLIW